MSLRYKFDAKYPTLVRYVLEKRGWKSCEPGVPWNLYWRSGRFTIEEIHKTLPFQKVNHFVNSGVITKKAGITHHIEQLKKKYGPVYDFMPSSFVFNKDNKESILKQINETSSKNNLWIAKPSTGSQGRGIQIIDDLDKLNNLTQLYSVQKYIHNPYLIKGYKFDIRLYALVTSYHPMTVYLYREGLVRFATQKYKKSITGTSLDKFIHLTNTSINKHNPIFLEEISDFETEITSVIGHGTQSKRTLRQLISYFYRQNIDFRPIWNQIKKSVILSLLPIGQYVPKNTKSCFELYGIDVILDENLKSWLLEVNFSPSLTCESNIDQTVKEGLIDDLIDILDFKPADVYEKENISNLEFYSNIAKRSTGNGGFELIYPFDDVTKEVALKYSDRLDRDIHEKKIIELVEEKYCDKGK